MRKHMHAANVDGSILWHEQTDRRGRPGSSRYWTDLWYVKMSLALALTGDVIVKELSLSTHEARQVWGQLCMA